MRKLILALLMAANAHGQLAARLVIDGGQILDLTRDTVPRIEGVEGALLIHLDTPTHYQGETGVPVYFERLEAHDSIYGQGWQTVIGPDDPYRKTHWWAGSMTSHMIVPGEWIVVADHSFRWAPPAAAWADAVQAAISSEIDSGMLGMPRMAEALEQWGEAAPLGIAQVTRQWGKFFGGPNPKGWYETTHLRGDGYSNEHYDDLLWLGLEYLRSRRIEDWNFALRIAVAHAAGGIVHSTGSRWDGLPRYEKSGEDPVYGPRIVGGDNNPSHAKKWLRGLVLMEVLSGNPVLSKAVAERIARLERDTERAVWDGSWGARIGARHLDDLYVAWVRTGRGVFRTRAALAIGNWVRLLDPQKGYWVNRGSPNTTSPWMNAELAAAMLRWMAVGVAVDQREAVLDASVAIWAQGTDDEGGGIRSVRYRFFGPEASRGHLSLLGYMVPMLRALAREREAWSETYLAHRAFLAAHVGVSWGQPTTDPVTYRYAPQGSGHPKALKQCLAGALR